MAVLRSGTLGYLDLCRYSGFLDHTSNILICGIPLRSPHWVIYAWTNKASIPDQECSTAVIVGEVALRVNIF